MILCADPRAQYLSHKAAIDEALANVLAGGRYILGEEVAAFEREFAAYGGCAHALGVNSGTDALILALRALGVGAGDEVITVSHTAVATVAAIVGAGASPVLVDIDPETYTIDPVSVERAISPRTRAIVAVHLYGMPADMDSIMSLAEAYRLKVVEDCAQATGARYKGRRAGSIGHAGCFSFYPTKNLGAIGDGGMVVTNDSGVAEKVRSLRQYGWDAQRDSTTDGVNSRLDEIQAAILRAKLPALDRDNARRREIAAEYAARLGGTGLMLPSAPPDREHAYHLYVVRSPARDESMRALHRSGVMAGIHYPVPVHLQSVYRDRRLNPFPLPQTERAAAEILSLPMYPELTREQVETIVGAMLSFAAPAKAS